MTNLIDNYLLQSGMPSEELKQIGRTKRSFYYYGMAFLGGIAIVLISSGLFNILT